MLCATWLHAAPIKTEHAEVELIAEKTALVRGEKNVIGLSIKHAPHWHTYWKNPGDSGYPTKITWDVPSGFGVGEFEWPTPKRLATGPIVNFGYEGEVLLPVAISVPLAASVGESVTLKGKAEWLVCKDVCIPEEGFVSLTLPVAAGNASGANSARFAAARAATPGDASAWKATLYAPPNPARDAWLDLAAPAGAAALTALDVFPVPEQVNDPSVQQVFRTALGYAVKLKLVDGVKLSERMPIVLAGSAPVGVKGERAGTTLATVNNTAFVLPAGATALGGAATNGDASANALTFWSALLLAFLGGMVLNLMPCVFPVLSLKILSFAKYGGGASGSGPSLLTEEGWGEGDVRLKNKVGIAGQVPPHPGAGGDKLVSALPRGQRGQDGARAKIIAMRQHGIYYAVGVVLSFLALAAVMLALKSAGSAVGWGFQLQNPGVVWVLAVIFFLIGLNLMGAFEFGQLAPSSLLSMQAQHPGVDAFFSGVLAVIAASPCTAPFMGAALGFALTQSAAAALAVFAALGIGMALPYVLLAWFPKWLDKLPRPGQWMVTFKQLLAFPMFLTVVWLVWVISKQAGTDDAAIGLLGLVGLAFAAWLIGSMRSGVRWAGVAAALIATALAWPASDSAQAATGGATNASKANWQAWDPAAVAKLNSEGKPVFVDFTAAWCVSCQANKKLVLTRTEIVDLFAQKQVTLMRADWTNRDERITQALAAMNRSGVPVYVLHAPGKAPKLLPELLTTGIVKEALVALP